MILGALEGLADLVECDTHCVTPIHYIDKLHQVKRNHNWWLVTNSCLTQRHHQFQKPSVMWKFLTLTHDQMRISELKQLLQQNIYQYIKATQTLKVWKQNLRKHLKPKQQHLFKTKLVGTSGAPLAALKLKVSFILFSCYVYSFYFSQW